MSGISCEMSHSEWWVLLLLVYFNASTFVLLLAIGSNAGPLLIGVLLHCHDDTFT